MHSLPIYHPLSGEISLPGDKSISHRAILLNSIAEGTAELTNTLLGADNLATIQSMQALGVTIKILDSASGKIKIHGVGLNGLKPASQALDLANSGTAARLLTGIMVGQKFSSTLIGDESLSKRPMKRIIEPLQLMGANISGKDQQFLPIHIKPAQLTGIQYVLPIASAQVKSCLLFAGLYADGKTTVIEPEPARDHSERMLQLLDADIHKENLTTYISSSTLHAKNIDIPGDISSAAFFIVAATLIQDSHIILKHVGINPTRTGIIEILKLMGADITLRNISNEYEPYADIEIRSAKLHGINIPKQLVVSAIDEFPIIFIAAAFADGITRLENAAELTVKESNRLLAMHEGLKKTGIHCQLVNDGIEIQGGKMNGAQIETHGDHRIAMAFLIAGAVAQEAISVNHAEMIDTSFPGFKILANSLGMKISS